MNKIYLFLLFSVLIASCAKNKNEKNTVVHRADTNINNSDNQQAKRDSIAFLRKEKYEQYINGTGFETVGYGDQNWTKYNLNVSVFRNGDTIPEAKTNEEWKEAGRLQKPVWCYYNDDSGNGGRSYYGKLYNFWAVIDERGLAPEGFHIPNNDEWEIFLKFLGNDRYDQWSTTAGLELISENGFNALLGGYRDDSGAFNDIEKDNHYWNRAHWWTSTYRINAGLQNENIYPEYVELDNEYRTERPTSTAYNQNYGFSVRCIRGVQDTLQVKKQAKKELQADFAVVKQKAEYSRIQEEKEKQTNVVYATDGTKCTHCGLGIYRGGVCGQCGTVSRERLNESRLSRANCEGCNGSGYVNGYNGVRLCQACRGSGKQTY
jgi:uncharacterized protein (TIGR02145 family)